ncbi:MAG: efflux RND transporter periplasmic adaptor subunit, partial [Comamonadaceae bacterium]|nr:efflux RND transporter periplasmic adaptor subunit [Comamonadaceae bacterium]
MPAACSSLRPFRPFSAARQRGRKALPLALLAAALALGGAVWWQQRSTPSTTAARGPGGFGGPGGPFGGPPGAGGGQAQPVSVGRVERRDVRVLVSAIGTLNARATAVVRTKVAGELKALHLREGQEVKAGQLLAEIDPRSYQANVEQLQGSLQRDQALLANAELDLQRYQQLQAQDSIAGQQVDTQAALVRQYQGQVAADRAQLANARLQLDYTRITAPIAGRLGLRTADLGNVLNPGDTTGLVTITQVRPIDAVFAVPEAHLPALRAHLAQGVAVPVQLWDREQKELLAEGRVSAIDNAIDVSTGTFKIKAAFANEDARLYANQFVNVRLQLDLLAQALTVPAAALQNNAVYVVQEDGTVAQRRLRTLAVDGERVAVQGDLPEGAQVVTDGLDRLREGA